MRGGPASAAWPHESAESEGDQTGADQSDDSTAPVAALLPAVGIGAGVLVLVAAAAGVVVIRRHRGRRDGEGNSG